MSDDPNQDQELEALFKALERENGITADNTARMMDDYLKHSDRVIANAAALKSLNTDDLIRSVLANPT